MLKKIIIFSTILLTALIFACGDTAGVKHSQDDATDYPADNPADDDPFQAIKLESLTIPEGQLMPAFKPDTYSYEVTITPETEEVNVSARPPKDCYAEINGTPVTHDNYTASLPVTQRITDISISTSDNSHAGETYSLKLTRPEEKIIGNSSFELSDENNHPLSWELSGSGEFTSSGEFFFSGTCSASFTTLTSTISGREILSSPIMIEQGKNIIASAWFYLPQIENSLSGRVSISLKIYYFTDADCMYPASTAYATMAKTTLKQQGVWEKINYMREIDDIPSDTGFVRIGIRVCYNTAGGGTKFDKIYFDNISLQQ